MIYKLRFHEKALIEWQKLDKTIQQQFKKKLAERLEHPRLLSAILSGMPDCYKIKLRASGFRLVYLVDDEILYVTVIAFGKRDKSKVYKDAKPRL